MIRKSKNVYLNIIIGIWIVIFILGLFGDFSNKLVAYGSNINIDLFRYFTASFVHINIFHLLANCVALYFVAIYLDDKVNIHIWFIFVLLIASITNTLFAYIYPLSEVFFGGSPIVFSSYGLILSMQIICKKIERFKLGTWYGNWSFVYFLLSNLINGNMRVGDISLIVIHGLAFALGTIMGLALCLIIEREK